MISPDLFFLLLWQKYQDKQECTLEHRARDLREVRNTRKPLTNWKLQAVYLFQIILRDLAAPLGFSNIIRKCSMQYIIVHDDYKWNHYGRPPEWQFFFVWICMTDKLSYFSWNVTIVFKWRTNFITTLQLVQFMALHLSSSSLSVTCEMIAPC